MSYHLDNDRVTAESILSESKTTNEWALTTTFTYYPFTFLNGHKNVFLLLCNESLNVTELLPSSPEGVQVDVISESELNITWDKPLQNTASITEYAVNVTMLKSFDNNPVFSKYIANQNSSWIVVTPHSVQVKVRITH